MSSAALISMNVGVSVTAASSRQSRRGRLHFDPISPTRSSESAQVP